MADVDLTTQQPVSVIDLTDIDDTAAPDVPTESTAAFEAPVTIKKEKLDDENAAQPHVVVGADQLETAQPTEAADASMPDITELDTSMPDVTEADDNDNVDDELANFDPESYIQDQIHAMNGDNGEGPSTRPDDEDEDEIAEAKYVSVV